MRYTSYLFDFDGTLVDSMPSYISAMLRIPKEYGIGYGEDLIKIITPLGYAGAASYYVKELGVPLPKEEIVRRMKEYAYEQYAFHIEAKPEVIETLRHLKEKGADLHILTASPHAVLDVCLSRLGIVELFDNVWSADDFGTTKADPNIYKMAAGRIGKSPEDILFLDDNLNALKTAADAGMGTCGVYDDSSLEYTEEIRAVAEDYVRTFGELLARL